MVSVEGGWSALQRLNLGFEESTVVQRSSWGKHWESKSSNIQNAPPQVNGSADGSDQLLIINQAWGNITHGN